MLARALGEEVWQWLGGAKKYKDGTATMKKFSWDEPTKGNGGFTRNISNEAPLLGGGMPPMILVINNSKI